MEEKIYIDSTDNIKLCALLANVSQDKIVLLCHGIRGNKDERGSFIELAKEIQKQGYSTIRIDFRAHGESTGIDYETNISKEIEDIEAVLKFLESIGYKEIIYEEVTNEKGKRNNFNNISYYNNYINYISINCNL